LEIQYFHDSISPEEVIKFLSMTGQSTGIFYEMIKNKEVLKKAGELGITVSDEELQSFADNFRSLQGLHSASDMNMFLDKSGLTIDDFETFCEGSILTNHLKENFAGERQIEEYFVNNRSDFDLVRISSITVKEENLAHEIIMQVEEDEEDFHVLARKHSLEDSKYAGGYIGLVSRKMLSPDITAKVFTASPGELTGPFQQDECFRLFFIEEVLKAQLNDTVRDAIQEIIFSEWGTQFLKKGINVRI